MVWHTDEKRAAYIFAIFLYQVVSKIECSMWNKDFWEGFIHWIEFVSGIQNENRISTKAIEHSMECQIVFEFFLYQIIASLYLAGIVDAILHENSL